MPRYNWQEEPLIGPGEVRIDGKDAGPLVIAADTDEGWIDVYEDDGKGNPVLVFRGSERELNVVRMYGRVEVKLDKPYRGYVPE